MPTEWLPWSDLQTTQCGRWDSGRGRKTGGPAQTRAADRGPTLQREPAPGWRRRQAPPHPRLEHPDEKEALVHGSGVAQPGGGARGPGAGARQSKVGRRGSGRCGLRMRNKGREFSRCRCRLPVAGCRLPVAGGTRFGVTRQRGDTTAAMERRYVTTGVWETGTVRQERPSHRELGSS